MNTALWVYQGVSPNNSPAIKNRCLKDSVQIKYCSQKKQKTDSAGPSWHQRNNPIVNQSSFVLFVTKIQRQR